MEPRPRTLLSFGLGAALVGCPSSRHERDRDAGVANASDSDADLDSDADVDSDSETDSDTDSDSDVSWDDRDGDRIPDALDPDPGNAQAILLEDDFDDGSEGWTSFGQGTWVDSEGEVAQTDTCFDGWAVYSPDGVSEQDVYVQASMYLIPLGEGADGPCGGSLGAGVVARQEGSPSFHACALVSEDGISTTLRLMRIEGYDWVVSDPSSVASVTIDEPLLDQWLTIGLTADGPHLTCGVVGFDDLLLRGYDATPGAGGVGFLDDVQPVLFDDFLVVDLSD